MKRIGHRRFTVPVASAVLTMCVGMLVTAQEPQRYARPEMLVETTWLADHLDDQSIRIVDVRRDGYDDGHIPGAVWLDIAVTRDATNAPSFLPSPEAFARIMGELGISNETRVVFYDDRGGVYGARPWAVLNHFGHSNVSIVNGGWPKWVSERRPSTIEVPNAQVVTFTPTPARAWIATAEDVRRAIDDPLARILDTRTEAEIDGSDLRGIMRGGYVPSATAIHWEDTLEGEHQMFKSSAALYSCFSAAASSRPTPSSLTAKAAAGRRTSCSCCPCSVTTICGCTSAPGKTGATGTICRWRPLPKTARRGRAGSGASRRVGRVGRLSEVAKPPRTIER